MKAMICEMCGGNNLVKEDGLYVCQSCGTKYSVEEARKLLGTVKVDKSEDTQKLLILARRAREENNSENAEKYYDLVLQDEPNNWEASFFQVYYQAMQCKIMDIANAAISVANNIVSTMRLIADMEDTDNNEVDSPRKEVSVKIWVCPVCKYKYESSEPPMKCPVCKVDGSKFRAVNEDGGSASEQITVSGGIGGEKGKALDTVISYSFRIANLLASGAVNHYNQYPNADNAMYECNTRIVATKSIHATLEDTLKKYFSCDTARILVVQKEYNSFIISHSKFLDLNYRLSEVKRLTSEILSKEPSYKVSNSSGGCYVATAVYGSYDCPEVWTLRRYRDYTLAKTCYGRAFIRTYYAISPTLVKWFGKTNWFKSICKPNLDRLVHHLNSKGVSDEQYNDMNY